jgi:hypothetical protein
MNKRSVSCGEAMEMRWRCDGGAMETALAYRGKLA